MNNRNLLIAAGAAAGLYLLTRPASAAVTTSTGQQTAGVLAQINNLLKTIFSRQQAQQPQAQQKPSSGGISGGAGSGAGAGGSANKSAAINMTPVQWAQYGVDSAKVAELTGQDANYWANQGYVLPWIQGFSNGSAIPAENVAAMGLNPNPVLPSPYTGMTPVAPSVPAGTTDYSWLTTALPSPPTAPDAGALLGWDSVPSQSDPLAASVDSGFVYDPGTADYSSSDYMSMDTSGGLS